VRVSIVGAGVYTFSSLSLLILNLLYFYLTPARPPAPPALARKQHPYLDLLSRLTTLTLSIKLFTDTLSILSVVAA
jgi:hypothetical protein